MRIGQLADAAGLAARTIRFYERQGLLPTPVREANGYRDYDDAALDRLAFIRAAQGAGLTLADIRGVIATRNGGRAPCTHVTELLTAKLEEIHRRREHLDALEGELVLLLDRSRRLDPADCTSRDVCHILRPPTADRD